MLQDGTELFGLLEAFTREFVARHGALLQGVLFGRLSVFRFKFDSLCFFCLFLFVLLCFCFVLSCFVCFVCFVCLFDCLFVFYILLTWVGHAAMMFDVD